MNTSIVRYGICLTFLFCGIQVANAADQGFSTAEAKAIDTFLNHHFADRDFGFVIGLMDENGGRVFHAGHLSSARDRKVDGDTLFEIGSVTKTFTSLLLLDRAQAKELDVKAPASNYLPVHVNVPSRGGKQITLWNLAVQDSGLPFNAANLADGHWLDSYDAYTAENMYEFLSTHDLTADPGARFQYSNIGMSLLGHVLELQSGSNFESLVVNRICEPLEMNDTRIRLSREQTARLAVGHGANGEAAPYYNLQVMEAAGSLKSTANDMLKYLAAQLGFRSTRLAPLIKKTQIIRHEGSPQLGNSAMPWYDRGVYQPPGSRFLSHGGGTAGFSTFLGFDTLRRRGVVVLTNQRIEAGNQRTWLSAGLGWAILQGLPLTPDRGSELIYERIGFGIEWFMDASTSTVQIRNVIPESPAGRSELSAGWILKKVGDVSTDGRNLDECLSLIIGPENTNERLEFWDPEENKTQVIELTREKFLTLR